MRLATIVVLVLLLSTANAWAVETGESKMGFQAGASFLDGKLGELFAPDFAFGLNMGYGITDHIAVVADILYAEHEQSDRDEYGALGFTQYAFAIGPEFGYTARRFAVNGTLAPLVTLMSYQARYAAGSGSDSDELDSHGFGAMAEAGVDAFVSGGATIGLIGRVNVVSTDMEFAHGADVDNRVDAYTFYNALVRFTLIF